MIRRKFKPKIIALSAIFVFFAISKFVPNENQQPNLTNIEISVNFSKRPNIYNQINDFPSNHTIKRNIVNLTTQIIPFFPGRIFYETDYFDLFHETSSWIDFNSIWKLEATYIELNDTYVNGFGAFICSNIWCRMPFYNHFKMTDGIIEKEVNEAIYFSNAFMHMYAHMLMDFLAPFLQLNEEIRKNVPIIVSAQCERVLELYEILGYNPNNTIILSSRDNWIHVNHLYTIYGEQQVNVFFGIAYFKLKRILHEKLRLDQQKPTMYLLYNREKGVSRHFINFQMLCYQIKRIDINLNDKWEITSEIPFETKKAAIFWNNVKFVFMPTGSNVANCIFMQSCSVVCIQMMEWNDTPAIAACFSSNITVFISLTSKCYHFSPGICKANIQSAVKSVTKALKYLETNF